VTGAGRFIGGYLTESLWRSGANVRALAHCNRRRCEGYLKHLKPDSPEKLEVRSGDVTDPYQVRDLVKGLDVVFHLAALIGGSS